jgi:ABC-type lipoprotein release transport system permease subunit
MLWGLLPGVMLMTWGVQIIGAGIVRDVTPLDFIAVPIVVLLVGLFAGYVPARRASHIDPTVALRQL